jgi:hypothetical protein
MSSRRIIHNTTKRKSSLINWESLAVDNPQQAWRFASAVATTK